MALTETLPRLIGTVLGMASSRLELASLDLEDELQWVIGTLLAGTAAVMLASFALLFGAFALVGLYWDTHRVAALMVAAGVFAVLAAGITTALLRFLHNKPRFLAATLAELEKDKKCLES
jgi:uncharacterized membrane protein YqjE